MSDKNAAGQDVPSIDWLGFVESVKRLMDVCEAPTTSNGGHPDVVREERIQYFAAKGEIWETISKLSKPNDKMRLKKGANYA